MINSSLQDNKEMIQNSLTLRPLGQTDILLTEQLLFILCAVSEEARGVIVCILMLLFLIFDITRKCLFSSATNCRGASLCFFILVFEERRRVLPVDEVVLMRLWPKVDGDEFYSSDYMHVQLNSLRNYEESLK